MQAEINLKNEEKEEKPVKKMANETTNQSKTRNGEKMKLENILSIDAETNGLRGKPFAVALVRQHEDGTIEKVSFRCPITENLNPWVAENVLPALIVAETHKTYYDMLLDVAETYKKLKQDAIVIAHCGTPVESNLFAEMYTAGVMGEFEGPFPLHEVGTMLLAKGENPFSVDEYVRKNNIDLTDIEGSTHDPEYDAMVALKVWNHCTKNQSKPENQK